MFRLAASVLPALLIFGATDGDDRVPTTPQPAGNADKLFAAKNLPLLKAKCLACHGEDPKGKLKGDLDLRTRRSSSEK